MKAGKISKRRMCLETSRAVNTFHASTCVSLNVNNIKVFLLSLISQNGDRLLYLKKINLINFHFSQSFYFLP